MEEMRLGQLTKEMVAEELRRLGDPCAAAAQVVRRTLTAALENLPPGGTPPKRVIEDAVQGALTALLLHDQSMGRGAVKVLEAVNECAAAANLDPTETMQAALQGLADMKRFLEPSRIDDIRHEIDKNFMGAGEVFAEYLRQVQPAKS